jgi:hypothetical protein
VSEQRVSASVADSVPLESEEERAAREEDELMRWLRSMLSGIMKQTQL